MFTADVVYRVAHNVAASHVLKTARPRTLTGLDEIANIAARDAEVDRRLTLERLYALIQQLEPLDREVMLLYLEDVDAASIGEITGISPSNVATKIHRIKKVLANRIAGGAPHAHR
ncbi:MAG TPA: sigma-70 family RNA polymerase sigma factor [Thermoanaerobaculia bacterium]|nr:sigma-70 family RNA polymerase sigma factor [Thermoanaerobaculia bacterium]